MKESLWKSSIGSFLILLSFLLIAGNLNAHVITGRVIDASTGAFLPGANVMLSGTRMGAASNRFGVYRIDNVPPGKYVLKVSYIGYKEFQTQVTVSSEQRVVTLDIALQVSAVKLKTLVVEGLREGQVKALSQQRSSPNIKNVVSEELLQRFPDENMAEQLARVPGVFIDREWGVGRYVLIRGTSQNFNAVAVNGNKLATNRREERYPQLDIIGTSQFSSIEVVKAITPDMDGDAIAGAVNLVTPSAFDYPGARARVDIGGGYADIRGRWVGATKVFYANKFGAKKNIGITLSAGWDRKNIGTDESRRWWGDRTDINGNPIPYAMKRFDFRQMLDKYDRYSIGGAIEYRLNDAHRWYIRGTFGQYNDWQLDGRLRIRPDKGDYLTQDGLLVDDARVYRYDKYRTEKLQQNGFSIGGVDKFGDMQLDYEVATSYAYEKHLPATYATWNLDSKVDLKLNLGNPADFPKWSVLNLNNDYLYDPTHYVFSDIEYTDHVSWNRTTQGGLNFKIPYILVNVPSELKFGSKVTLQHKVRNDDVTDYSWNGAEDITMDQLAFSPKDWDWPLFNGEYDKFGPKTDQDKLMDFFDNNRASFDSEMDYDNTIGQDFDAKEKVFAYYAMTTMNMGGLTLLGGFRHEFTNLEYEGTELYYNENGDYSSSQKVLRKSSYNNFLPMVHVRYRLNPMTNLRLAYTHSISRPSYWDLAPYFIVDPHDEVISAGNTKLKPTTSQNIDLMLERYFQAIGVFSGGFFYKNLHDIVFNSTFIVQGGNWDGYEMTQPVNGGDAILYGFEVAWQQELTFLPGFLNGFGIFANYTHTWSDADLLGRKGFLPGQAGDVGNISLSYEKSDLSLRLTGNFNDKYIMDVGQTKDDDEWRNKRFQIDFSSAYKVNSNLQVYLNWININNAHRVDYLGIRYRTKRLDYYGSRIVGGIRYTFGS